MAMTYPDGTVGNPNPDPVDNGFVQGNADGKRIGRQVSIKAAGFTAQVRFKVPNPSADLGMNYGLYRPVRCSLVLDTCPNGTAATAANIFSHADDGARFMPLKDRFVVLGSALLQPRVISAATGGGSFYCVGNVLFKMNKKFRTPIVSTWLDGGSAETSLATNQLLICINSDANDKVASWHYDMKIKGHLLYTDA